MVIQWVALDWGTTNLSAYAIGEAGQVLDAVHSDKGMSRLAPREFEPTLLKVIGAWLTEDRITPVVACGMVGAQQGWLEVPYSEVPCLPVSPDTAICVPVKDRRLTVCIVPGVSQRHPDDVMRGEETQIAGYLAENPGFDGVFCLPGTHSKWVQIEGGKICEFKTFMTGELFGLLTQHSVLRFCTKSTEWDDAAFLKAVEATIFDPSGLTAKLFSLRSSSLLGGPSREVLRAQLSGLLIGAEIATMRKIWGNRDLVIIGNRENSRLYQRALAACGLSPQVYDNAQAIIQGLRDVAAAVTLKADLV